MERTGFFIFILLFNPGILFASKKDTIVNISNPKSTFLKQQILPVSIITVGALLTVWDQTKYLALAQLISAPTVQLLKGITKVPRPDGSDNFSFPSGHTANAFTGATVLYHEFKDTEPLLAWSGYLVATATGALRLTNNAHWLPDVLVGAGIGILSANIVYYFEPLKSWQPFKKNKDLAFTPLISPGSVGIHVRF